MEDPREKLTTFISKGELERRWKAVRDAMREEKVDYLVMQNVGEYLGGYVKWFSGFSARHNPFTVIFPVDEDMTLINHGPRPPAEASPPKWAVHGVKSRLGAPYIPSLHYTNTYDAELAAGVLKEKTLATIGLVGRAFISVTFYEYLRKHLPEAKFVDLTDQIDRIKAIKSAEEVELITRAAELQDAALEHVKKVLRPGMRGFELLAEAQASAIKQGSECQYIMLGSAPPNAPGKSEQRHLMNRMIREGDQVSILLEVNGPGGFYAELGRTLSLGKPSQELQDAFGVALEAQEVTLNLLKPGADPKDICDAHNEFLQKRGYRPERRLYAHGQGYDLVERPAIRDDETMKIKAGMNIAIHPAAAKENVWGRVCDNYLVTETGVSPCLHKTPKEIIVI